MKYFVIAGEASGDLHASNLMKGIRKADQKAVFTAWGGDLMHNQGAEVLKHIRELAFMGFTEVLMNIGTIFRNLSLAKQHILQHKPDALILVDYPGFNMRIAKWAHSMGIRVFYYISPNVWAWKTNRVHHFKKYCEKLFVILPFEKEFYNKFGIDVVYHGHPLVDAVEAHNHPGFNKFCSTHNLSAKPIIALLAGSRKQEISKMLPQMLKLVDEFSEYQFVIAGAPAIERQYYEKYISGSHVALIMNKTYDVLSCATAGIVVSGTATLEAALFKMPQVVGYRAGLISAIIARMLMKVKFISLVNLIMQRQVVTELLQFRFNSKNLAIELQKILPGTTRRSVLQQDYESLAKILGESGASQRVGFDIVTRLQHEIV
ncbi:MAG TPA: lipid-A-disaccharide synthase [Bacteroidales bacterium]|nr:lipid-A-disaccharide synthase [Bacteroidales bacterium]